MVPLPTEKLHVVIMRQLSSKGIITVKEVANKPSTLVVYSYKKSTNSYKVINL